MQYLRNRLRPQEDIYWRPSGWGKVKVTAIEDWKDALEAVAHILLLSWAEERDWVARPRHTTAYQGRVTSGVMSGKVTYPQGNVNTWKTHLNRFAPRDTDFVKPYRAWFGCPGGERSWEACGSTRYSRY